MCRDQRFVAIARMRGRVADTREALHARKPLDQSAEADALTLLVEAAISIHVLAEQGELQNAASDAVPCFGFDLGRGSRVLGAARIRHDAERAELVAPFL